MLFYKSEKHFSTLKSKFHSKINTFYGLTLGYVRKREALTKIFTKTLILIISDV